MAAEADRPLTDPETMFGSDTEHDARVRRRLAELAEERGISVDDVLGQLNAALREGDALLPTGSGDESGVESAGLPRSAVVAEVVERRPADEVWAVVSLHHDGPPVAQRSPCAGPEPCPWRRDATLRTFPVDAFRFSARTSYPDSDHRFQCHSSTAEAPRICAGWLLRGASGNQSVQRLLQSARLKAPVLPAEVELYDNYAEMAVANGVSADDPLITSCRQVVKYDDSDEFV
ncbi:DUF6283 family protein [Streptomyces niveus]|uniref:DUF6283 family protein n=1 Tax=Streptomyces niveus TaxID=193462 RepID=UPI00341E7FBF